MSKKQFTLDSWLKDKSQKVVTRCGFPVRIVCTDVKRKDYPILALVERDDQEEYQSFTKDGRFSLYNPLHDNFDLFIETADEVSEGEKVMKALIDFFGKSAKYGGQTNGVYDKDILAWLEKQDPKKHEEELENAYKTADKVQYKRGYEDAVKEMEKQGEKHPDPYNGISFEYNGHIWGMCARDNGVDISCDKHLIKHLEEQGEKLPVGFYYVNSEGKKFYSDTFKYGNVILHVEKQGEQKPADKVEPKFKVGDKIYLKPEYRMPDDDTPIANTVKEIRRIDDKHYRFDGSYIFIEDQDKYELVEQKPAWSEEDEKRLNSCLNILQPKTFVGNTETINTKWLKSLKGRVGCEANCTTTKEWSEEDEQHIDSLLKRLDALCRNKFERTRFAISEDRDWLKSLRPQNRWKPSDEQIKVCKEVYADLLSAKGFDLGTVNSELNRMEEQLKKLKKE